MEIMDENNGVAEEQEEFQRLEMQVEEEAVFPQENVQSTDPSVPMDTQGVEAQGEPPYILYDFGFRRYGYEVFPNGIPQVDGPGHDQHPTNE